MAVINSGYKIGVIVRAFKLADPLPKRLNFNSNVNLRYLARGYMSVMKGM